ncbi:hypothetical protein BRYFOR_08148 [Marvinbryantia formatexigens DSM 14469]|uniref:Uncharacterized protein n=1 Tax=Marvinbryantia formatexigens DSM 14469 TaxID=478749 RepID=C6LHN7_9FIRM|nr:hypothetical protein BRYFOR_08148 [Marvinbryantia formatexigens DSM 14469]
MASIFIFFIKFLKSPLRYDFLFIICRPLYILRFHLNYTWKYKQFQFQRQLKAQCRLRHTGYCPLRSQ